MDYQTEVRDAFPASPLMTDSLRIKNRWLQFSSLLLLVIAIFSALGVLSPIGDLGERAAVVYLSLAFISVSLLTLLAYYLIFRPWALRADEFLALTHEGNE